MDAGMPSEPKELPEEDEYLNELPKETKDEYLPESVASVNPRPPSKSVAWSVKELKKLHRLASAGQPIDVISAALKRTQAAVNGAFSKILLQQIMHSSIEDVAKHYGETVGSLQASLLPPKYHIPLKGSLRPIVASHSIAGVDTDVETDTDNDYANNDANESATDDTADKADYSNGSVESEARSDSHCFTTMAVFMASFVAIYAYGHYVIKADLLYV